MRQLATAALERFRKQTRHDVHILHSDVVFRAEEHLALGGITLAKRSWNARVGASSEPTRRDWKTLVLRPTLRGHIPGGGQHINGGKPLSNDSGKARKSRDTGHGCRCGGETGAQASSRRQESRVVRTVWYERVFSSTERSTFCTLTLSGTESWVGAKFKIAVTPASTN